LEEVRFPPCSAWIYAPSMLNSTCSSRLPERP
jgi:hypothetical protein